MFDKKPLCEECGKNEATSFSFIPAKTRAVGGAVKGDWKFVCECAINDENHYMPIEHFFSKPCFTVDSMAHMHEKTWMDWGDFMDMMTRFRDAIH